MLVSARMSICMPQPEKVRGVKTVADPDHTRSRDRDYGAAAAQTLQGGVGLLDIHKAATSASRGSSCLSHNVFNSQQGWLKQHRLQQAALYSTDAGPIKSKGMTAGTLPPAADQVPPDNSTAPVKEQAAATVQQTLAAASERSRPASKSGPPGLDQVPASAQPGPSNQEHEPADLTVGSDIGANAAAAPAVDLQSAAQVSSQGQQCQAKGNNSEPAGQQTEVSGWQRFTWLLWGTPPEYWKRGKAGSEAQHLSAGDSSSSGSHGTASTASGTAAVTDSQDVKKSRFSLAGVIERAILRTRVVRDEDVAR